MEKPTVEDIFKWLDGQQAEARKFYQKAQSFQAKLGAEDRPIFDATFNLIPNPQN